MTTYQTLGLMISLAATFFGIIAFFIIRWMNRVEALLVQLSDKVHKTEIGEAKIFGMMEAVCNSVDKTAQSIGALNASVGNIWDIIIRKGFADERPSDLRNGN